MQVHHDPVGSVEAETGPLARFLGGEEAVKDPPLNLFRNARPSVIDFHHNPVAFIAGAQHDLALAVYGVHGVVDQIGPHLI